MGIISIAKLKNKNDFIIETQIQKYNAYNAKNPMKQNT